MKSWYQFIKENQGDKSLSDGLMDRKQLPQIDSGKEQDFVKFLNNKGISVQKKTVKAKDMTPMQNHINQPKVDEIRKCVKDSKGNCVKKWNFFLSHDYKILDGHHRWHSMDPDHDANCHVANASFPELVSAGHEFNNQNDAPSDPGSTASPNTSGQAGAAGTSE